MSDHVYWYKCDVTHGREHGIFIAVICRPRREQADEAFDAFLTAHGVQRAGEVQTEVDPKPEGDGRLAALLKKARENPDGTATQYVVCS